jgi:PHD/YefM family antitoxin component YafN of YafNO toxin-antitoxin module
MLQIQGMELVTVSEAKVKLHEVIRGLAAKTTFLLRHGKPVAAMLSYEAYSSLMDRIEDLEDRVAVYESQGEGSDMKVPWEKVKAESGLLG